MFIDSSELADRTTLKTSFCIVGAGAAGITLARELSASGKDCILLEAGGFDFEEESHKLYEGEESGTLLKKNSSYLSKTRQRFFGGTTNHWGGWCLPMLKEDFEDRPWITDVPWPINEEDLSTYYERSAEILDLAPFSTEGEPKSRFESDDLQFYNFHLSAPTRFGQRYRQELKDSSLVKVVLHASVKELHLAENMERVSSVEFIGANQRRHFVEAKCVVIASGGIENARLLLLSNSKAKNGIGNASDHLGRYFMEHPHIPISGLLQLYDEKGREDFSFFKIGEKRARPVLSLTPTAQRKEQLANSCLTINPIDFDRLPQSTRSDTTLLKDLSAKRGSAPYFGTIFVQSEQIPSASNRVSLSNEIDSLGLRKVKLEWSLGELDFRTVYRSIEMLGELVGKRELGRVKIAALPETPWKGGKGGSHHMGTTRMSSSVNQGVVDSDCKVFEVDNLYVAGSSVFPVGGIANPTFTIVALCLRLAKHLIDKVE